ncbi:MAG: geranylgeranylglycerol-phosphate geranylgeranyltransferase [Thaumarchaeota archaeon]|nr:geranylgeranylglycerol-phosphate geranylgeranyltransferase [Nitrososphaerota archaeon]
MSPRAYFSILRPVNCAMIGFAVIVGIFVSKPPSLHLDSLVLGFVTGFAICAYSMVINDYYDIEVDRVNQPGRPLPSGAISMKAALTLALAMLALGVLASVVLLNLAAVGIALLYALLSWLYNFRAKKYGLPGNVIVASSLAIPFIYGGVVSGGSVTSSLLLFMAGTAFLSGVGREVVKAMADTVGDEKRGIRSFARVYGMRSAALLGAGFFLASVVSSLLPLVLISVSVFYRVGVVVPDVVFVYLAYAILRKPTGEGALKVKTRALLGMLLGLIVFIGGAF